MIDILILLAWALIASGLVAYLHYRVVSERMRADKEEQRAKKHQGRANDMSFTLLQIEQDYELYERGDDGQFQKVKLSEIR